MKKFWIDKNIKSAKQAFMEDADQLESLSRKGRRLIIAYIGSENGFLDGGLLEFESQSTIDYHEEMMADVFEKYFQQITEYIPAESVIVLDNALYLSRLLECLPTNSRKKEDILQWISDKNLKHKDGMLKAELLKIVRQNKAQFKKYAVNEMAKKQNITGHRLPPYHCELNLIYF